LTDYLFLFAENQAGSAVLTAAMREKLPVGKVREPRDILYSKLWEVLDDRAYERMEKKAKERSTFFSRYCPSCSSFSRALRGLQERSKDAPYGHGEGERVEKESKLATRICALCRIHHEVGDAFSCEHIYPSYMLEFDCFKALLALPGVFLLTFDNCMYGERYL
jgi:hypothetical protein